MRLTYLFDGLAVLGGLLVLAGLWWMWPPLAVVVLGVVLGLGGFLGARLWVAIAGKGGEARASEPD